MWFPLPHPPLGFEIPDEWWAEAGMEGFRPNGPHFQPGDPYEERPVVIIQLDGVRPPGRGPASPLGASGLDRARMVSVLRAIRSGAAIEPVHVFEVEAGDHGGHSYGLYHGYHRLYASLAVGFTHIPMTCVGTEADVRRANVMVADRGSIS